MINPHVLKKASQIQLLILDVDGVLTDGKIYVSSTGEEFRAFHVLDGVGIKRLLEANIEVAVISSRKNSLVSHRMKELGVAHIYQGEKNKIIPFEKLIKKLNLDASNIAYIGDDLPDLEVMQRVGLAITVPNGVDAVKKKADWQTTRAGGKGAVREVCDMILGQL